MENSMENMHTDDNQLLEKKIEWGARIRFSNVSTE